MIAANDRFVCSGCRGAFLTARLDIRVDVSAETKATLPSGLCDACYEAELDAACAHSFCTECPALFTDADEANAHRESHDHRATWDERQSFAARRTHTNGETA